LHANGRIQARIEIAWAAENFGRDLILLNRFTWMIERLIRQIP
jgi:hypothetical protein